MDCTKELEVNVKIPQRPFKRCFKHATNTVTKWIWNQVNRVQFGRTSIITHNPFKIHNTSNSKGGGKRVRYASIKGCCGLQKNGFLR